MPMLRVVLDTNILVSACWTPDGLEAQTIALAVTGKIRSFVSAPVLAEYREILSRPKFARVAQCATKMLAELEHWSELAPSGETLHIASDENDNRFLECAAAVDAAYLITGNARHFPVSWGVTQVVNARQFLSAEFGLTEVRSE